MWGSSEVIEGRRRDVGPRAASLMALGALVLPVAVAVVTRALVLAYIGLGWRIPAITGWWLLPINHAVLALILLVVALIAIRVRVIEVFATTAALYVLATAVVLVLPVVAAW
jgi:hypothetical protein